MRRVTLMAVILPMRTIMSSRAGLPTPCSSTDAPQLPDVFRRELGLKLVKERTTVTDLIIEPLEPLIEN